jgi:hypothetical protein
MGPWRLTTPGPQSREPATGQFEALDHPDVRPILPKGRGEGLAIRGHAEYVVSAGRTDLDVSVIGQPARNAGLGLDCIEDEPAIFRISHVQHLAIPRPSVGGCRRLKGLSKLLLLLAVGRDKRQIGVGECDPLAVRRPQRRATVPSPSETNRVSSAHSRHLDNGSGLVYIYGYRYR